MALQLLEHPLSPYARKVKIVLYEKEIPFERVLVAPMRREGDAHWSTLVAASPRGEVPALVDGDLRIFDSTVIVDYIDEKWPDRPMLPSGPAARARVRMLEEICDSELDAINWGMMELAVFRRADGERADAIRKRAGEQLLGAWDRIERDFLVAPWASGDAFGRGDATLYPHVAGAVYFGFPLTSRHPKLRAWLAACAARPSVMRDTAEVVHAMTTGFGTEAHSRSRQYRDHRLEWMLKVGGRDIVLRGLDNGSVRLADDY